LFTLPPDDLLLFKIAGSAKNVPRSFDCW